MPEIQPLAVQLIADKLQLRPAQVAQTLELFITQKLTLPFVARYRKEATGNLNEVLLEQIQNEYEEFTLMERRRSNVLETLEKSGELSAELKEKILKAQTLALIEDLYAPFRKRKKTKAQQALEAGLGPMAQAYLSGTKRPLEIEETYLPALLEKKMDGLSSEEEILKGVQDIAIDHFAHIPELKGALRELYWEQGVISCQEHPQAKEQEQAAKFKDYFQFSCSVKDFKNPQNAYKYLAIRRGHQLKILKVDLTTPERPREAILERVVSAQYEDTRHWLKQRVLAAWKNYLHPALEMEIKNELKKLADEQAIKIFATNLKNLLLQPYLGAQKVLAIDPGIRTGCKVVVLDETSALLSDFVIYPFGEQKDEQASTLLLENALKHYGVKYLVVGSGTQGRETLAFVQAQVPSIKSGEVHALLVSEVGASVYSASELARSEFPTKDLTVRGAISIGRRFQDPLAELVKIEPKALGVGQYQHDVNQARLKKGLEQTVENCVNYVGVDVNTASAPLLTYISGLGKNLAQALVKHREEKGKFKTREDLLAIPQFSQKTFQLAAGFLKIYDGPNPLDRTFIHPEHYPLLETWAQGQKLSLKELTLKENVERLERELQEEKSLGRYSLRDIVENLLAPGQDPRLQFENIDFDPSLKTFDDLKQGAWYPGLVTNITQFGAFVDIGIKEKGLLHISEIAKRFTTDPLSVLKVGDFIQVRVIHLDQERRRISLSRKTLQDKKRLQAQTSGRPSSPQGRKKSRPSGPRGPRPQRSGPPRKSPHSAPLKNNALAQALSKFKEE